MQDPARCANSAYRRDADANSDAGYESRQQRLAATQVREQHCNEAQTVRDVGRGEQKIEPGFDRDERGGIGCLRKGKKQRRGD